MIIDLLIHVSEYLSKIIVYIIDTIFGALINGILFVAENTLLGFLGIFNIVYFKDVALISALILVALFSGAVVYLYPILKEYMQTDVSAFSFFSLLTKKRKKRRNSTTRPKQNNRNKVSSSKSSTKKKTTTQSSGKGKNKTTTQTTRKGETRITTIKEIKTPTARKRSTKSTSRKKSVYN